MKRHILIFGNQPLELNKAADHHIHKTLQKHPDADVCKLDCNELSGSAGDDLPDLQSELLYDGLFVSHSIVLIKNIEVLMNKTAGNKNAGFIKAMYAGMQKANKTLIFLANIRKITDLKGVLGGLTEHTATLKTTVTYDDFDPRAKITELANALSIRLERDAVDCIAETCGADFSLIAAELEKIALVFPPEYDITANDITFVLGNMQSYTVFGLTDSIVTKQKEAFHKIVGRYVEDRNNSIISLLYLLVSRFRKMLVFKTAEAAGKSQADILKAVGISPWGARKMSAELRHYRTEELETILIRFSQLDLRIKFVSHDIACLLLRDFCADIVHGRLDQLKPQTEFCRDLIY